MRFRERSPIEPHFAWHEIIEGSVALLASWRTSFRISSSKEPFSCSSRAPALQLDVRGDAQVAGAVIRREPASPKDRFSFEEPVQAAGLKVEMALV